MDYNLLGFLILSILALGAAVVLSSGERLWVPGSLFIGAVALRIIGSTLRYEVLFRFYNGCGDAVSYFKEGRIIAEVNSFLDMPFLSLDFWLHGDSWWGTHFMEKLSALVITFIGSTMRGEFLIFSFFAFAGLYSIAAAYKNIHPGDQAVQYTSWIWLWPSLWFWPSSVGKEAVTILAIGIATLGYTGRRDVARWPVYLAGVGLAFCIRPHVALALVLATGAAYWFGAWKGSGFRRIVEALVLVVVASMAFNAMTTQFGLAQADLEGLNEFVTFRAGQTLQGGSNIGSTPITGAGIPMAFVNVWMRPFPWDVHNLTSLIAAIEIMVFLWLVWTRRNSLKVALKHWRCNRLLRFAVPFAVGYTLMIGLTFGNLGIIARQRTPIIPFVFMILLAEPGDEEKPPSDEVVR
jgi:hypothetical protein